MKIGAEFYGADKSEALLRALGKAAEEKIAKAINGETLRLHGDMAKSVQRAPAGGVTYSREAGQSYMSVYVEQGGEKTPVAFFSGAGAQNLSGKHKASAPGEPPKSDTGTLAGGIVFNVRKGAGHAVGEVLSTAKHTPYMEFGTGPFSVRRANGAVVNYRGIKPRPFIRPAFDMAVPRIRKAFEDAVKKAVASALAKAKRAGSTKQQGP